MLNLLLLKSVSKCKFNKLCYEINDAIKDLKIGKSTCIDNLQSEHFKYTDQSLSCLLCMVFKAMFTHGYVPSKLMETIMIKDRKGLVTD